MLCFVYHFNTDLKDSITGTTTATTTGQISTSNPKFGEGSLYSTSSTLSESNNIPCYLDYITHYSFTVDFWYKTDGYWFGGGPGSVGMYLHGVGDLFKISNSGRGFIGANGSGSNWTNEQFQAVFPLNQWNHIAVQVDNGDVATVFINGQILVQSSFGTHSLWYANSLSLNNFFTNGFNQYIDEVRFSDVARYSGPFTPPAAPY